MGEREKECAKDARADGHGERGTVCNKGNGDKLVLHRYYKEIASWQIQAAIGMPSLKLATRNALHQSQLL